MTIYSTYILHFVLIWHIFSSFGIIHQEKSGNPVACLVWTSYSNTKSGEKLCEKFTDIHLEPDTKCCRSTQISAALQTLSFLDSLLDEAVLRFLSKSKMPNDKILGFRLYIPRQENVGR
jgi:hypothetical protein